MTEPSHSLFSLRDLHDTEPLQAGWTEVRGEPFVAIPQAALLALVEAVDAARVVNDRGNGTIRLNEALARFGFARGE